MNILPAATRFLFFTGKGGVGKTSLSTATAIQLADQGLRVLLVSTDAASNLDEMLGIPLRNEPVAVPAVPGLSVLNIDPQMAAEHYRQRVLAQMSGASEDERHTVREQLSGACTTEIASFDEFSSLLAEGGCAGDFDHLVFDTAPTGHTLRLLSLPQAWSGFLKDNDRGASCLGPHSGLKMQEARFNAALTTLSDSSLTTVVLVARADHSALREAERSSLELTELGLCHQCLAINGVFSSTDSTDAVARSIAEQEAAALRALPEALRPLPQVRIPLRPFDTVGVPALRALLSDTPTPIPTSSTALRPVCAEPLAALVEELARSGRGLIMVMGKGGVGKTTLAAALAVGLVQRGHAVHLSTTDPADHLPLTLQTPLAGLSVSRIDPKAETTRYIDKIMATRSPGLDAQQQALLLEDLQSPCTEEVAVFHAFSRTVAQARSAFVVLDTAPTGHSLLLMDATGAYHRQMTHEFEGQSALHVVTPLMRLQDPDYTRVVLVTLPEVTPVSQAAALQEDLRRAQVEPFAWVLNRSLLASGTQDPLLRARLRGEQAQEQRVAQGLAQRLYAVPWCAQPPVGLTALQSLVTSP